MSGIGFHIGCQRQLAFRALVEQDGRIIHRRMGFEHGFDLARFHAVAVDLHLLVLAAEEFEGAVVVVACRVSRAVETGMPVPGRQEGSGRLFGIVPVTEGQAVSADVKVSGDPVGTRLEAVIKDGEGLVGQRSSVRHGGPAGIVRARLVEVGPDGGLGGAAHGHDPDARDELLQARRQGLRDPVAAEDGQAEGQGLSFPFGRGIRQQLAEGRDGVPQADPVLMQQPDPGLGLQALFLVRDDDGAAGCQQAEDVVHGKVERQPGEGEDAVPGIHAVPPVDVKDGVHGRPVGDHDPLGRPRGARGIDDVGKIVGGDVHLRRELVLARFGQQVCRHEADAFRQGRGVRTAHDDTHAGIGQDGGDTGIGLAGVQRQIGGPGALDAQDGHDLFPASGQKDGDPVAMPYPGRVQFPGQGAAQAFGLAVGEGPVRTDDGGGIRPGPRHAQEGGEHGLAGHVQGRVVDRRAYGKLRCREAYRHGIAPGRIITGEAEQGLGVGFEHGIDHPVREEIAYIVEDDAQLAVHFEQLMVEPDLRGLGDAVDLVPHLPEGKGAGRGFHGQGAGEDHGHDARRRAASAAQFAQDADAAEGTVFHVVPQAAPQPSSPGLEAPSLRQVHRQEAVGGEFADQGIDLAMQGQAVEQGQIDAEALFFAPAPQDFGEGR